MAAASSKEAKQKQRILDLEGMNFAQGYTLVKIANLCRDRGGDLAAEILSMAGEVLTPKEEKKHGRGKT